MLCDLIDGGGVRPNDMTECRVRIHNFCDERSFRVRFALHDTKHRKYNIYDSFNAGRIGSVWSIFFLFF